MDIDKFLDNCFTEPFDGEAFDQKHEDNFQMQLCNDPSNSISNPATNKNPMMVVPTSSPPISSGASLDINYGPIVPDPEFNQGSSPFFGDVFNNKSVDDDIVKDRGLDKSETILDGCSPVSGTLSITSCSTLSATSPGAEPSPSSSRLMDYNSNVSRIHSQSIIKDFTGTIQPLSNFNMSQMQPVLSFSLPKTKTEVPPQNFPPIKQQQKATDTLENYFDVLLSPSSPVSSDHKARTISDANENHEDDGLGGRSMFAPDQDLDDNEMRVSTILKPEPSSALPSYQGKGDILGFQSPVASGRSIMLTPTLVADFSVDRETERGSTPERSMFAPSPETKRSMFAPTPERDCDHGTLFETKELDVKTSLHGGFKKALFEDNLVEDESKVMLSCTTPMRFKTNLADFYSSDQKPVAQAVQCGQNVIALSKVRSRDERMWFVDSEDGHTYLDMPANGHKRATRKRGRPRGGIGMNRKFVMERLLKMSKDGTVCARCVELIQRQRFLSKEPEAQVVCDDCGKIIINAVDFSDNMEVKEEERVDPMEIHFERNNEWRIPKIDVTSDQGGMLSWRHYGANSSRGRGRGRGRGSSRGVVVKNNSYLDPQTGRLFPSAGDQRIRVGDNTSEAKDVLYTNPSRPWDSMQNKAPYKVMEMRHRLESSLKSAAQSSLKSSLPSTVTSASLRQTMVGTLGSSMTRPQSAPAERLDPCLITTGTEIIVDGGQVVGISRPPSTKGPSMTATKEVPKVCWKCLSKHSLGSWHKHKSQPNKFLCNSCLEFYKEENKISQRHNK